MITSLFRLRPFFLLLMIFMTSSCQQTKDTSGSVGYADINVEEFKSKMSSPDVIILDVRTPEETAEGVIDGAVEIDYKKENFKDKVSQLDKEKIYLVYCRSGRRSIGACEIMQEMGFEKLYNLEGGYNGWSAENQ